MYFIGLALAFLMSSLSGAEYYHLFREVRGEKVILEDESEWHIGWWYRGVIHQWKAGDRLTITFHPRNGTDSNIAIRNVDTPGVAWGFLDKYPSSKNDLYIDTIPDGSDDPDAWSLLHLNSGLVFRTHTRRALYDLDWKIYDTILVFHNGGKYDLLNIRLKEFLWGCALEEPTPDQPLPDTVVERKDISGKVLVLEERLNQRVLDQPEATRAVASAFINHCAGLKNPKTPVRTFLFLGPTGVGKTELAKAVADELYSDKTFFLRFEMSHFTEWQSFSRLIGTAPGVADAHKGGQLTEALKMRPQAVVVFDEIEKADPKINKVLLSVFDEGVITDARSEKVACSDVAFILTSSLCSEQIAELYASGYSLDEILHIIEPEIVRALSPELYARVEPVIFRPLQLCTMERLIDIMLQEVIALVKETRGIDLTIDDSVKLYLMRYGFHPQLGARPLKALIQKKVTTNLSYALLKEQIPRGTPITLTCLTDDDWHVIWSTD